MHRFAIPLLGALAVLLVGCRLDPCLTLPDTDAKAAWRDEVAQVESLANTDWFDVYRDETLAALVHEAVVGNPDLGIALARIDESRALAHAVGADLYPRVDLAAQAGHVRSSRTAVPFGDRDAGTAALSFDLAWELDLFGRIRSEASGARSTYFATIEVHRDVCIRLVSEVARAYFELRELDERAAISGRTLGSRREYVDLAKTRFDGGKTSEIDYRQAEGEYFRTESIHVDTLRQVTVKENQIAVLLGRSPGPIPRGLPGDAQPLPAAVPAGLPSDLLRRRPDIQAAEYLLASDTALVGAARANLYPRIALTGSLGWESEELSDLFLSSSQTSSIIGGLLAPIFNAGKNRAAVDARLARMRGAMEVYRKTVLAAFGEVEDAIVDYRRFTEQRGVQDRRVTALRKVFDLAEIRYKGGVSQYLEVLDAQRELFDAELERSDTVEGQLVALTRLYKALGGGWDPACAGPAPVGACCAPCSPCAPPCASPCAPAPCAPWAPPPPPPPVVPADAVPRPPG